MNEFIGAALGFPAVLFGAALLVVIAFWLLVLAGAAEHDAFNSSMDTGTGADSAGGTGSTGGAGLGGVPVTIPVSLLIAIAWFTTLAGSVLVRRQVEPGTGRTLWSAAVLVAGALIAWGVTRLLVRRLRDLVPEQAPPSRLDFIGLTCTIRTGSVSADFGQAEVAAADGSTALVQVRQAETAHEAGTAGTAGALVSGSTGLLYAFDVEGEFFWVAPYDPALDPRNAA
ncbi:hypothetical protein [Streptomyces paludis]|uniref:DUF1449 family protein n=1 Tax=Streptomyces paludis TaxID=2282738 RepID=A0A345HP07_9ACTN|nr:hypothetical protein [Streptomyces paludis]AXG78431.1 hypothetical protein DVK44_12730 [Streptomyces paludis]